MAEWTETALAAGRIDVSGRRIGARTDGFTKKRREAFLDRLAATCCVRSATAVAGVTPTTVYAARRNDPAFAQAWQEALSAGYDAVERALLRYALSQGATGPGADGRDAATETSTDARDRTDAASIATAVPAWVRVGLMLVKRHEAAVRGRRAGIVPSLKATAAETDAALARRLDQLALRTKDRG